MLRMAGGKKKRTHKTPKACVPEAEEKPGRIQHPEGLGYMYSEKRDEAPVNPWRGKIYRLRSPHSTLQGFEACVYDCSRQEGPEMGDEVGLQ